MNPRKKLSNKNPLDIGFTLSLLLKGLFEVSEILSGAALFFLTPDRMNRLILWLSTANWLGGPGGWLMNRLDAVAQSFTAGTQHFVIFYLMSHGIVKLAVVILLWKKKLWAYPASVLLMCCFIVYQMIKFASGHSILLLLLTVLDVILIVLTVLEYRNMKLDAKNHNSAN